MIRTRRRILLAVALLAPIIILGASWAMTHRLAQQGQEWLVPISGYDPRDLLRGHYVQYRYDWPMHPEQAGTSHGEALCLQGAAPHIRNVRRWAGEADSSGTEGVDCAIIARAAAGTRQEVQGLDTGIFYASQDRAISLSRQLADPALQGFMRVKIRPDGVMRPVGLEFARKPR